MELAELCERRRKLRRHLGALVLAIASLSAAEARAEAVPGVHWYPNGVAVGGPIRPKSQAVIAPSSGEYGLQRHSLIEFLPIVHTTAIFEGPRWAIRSYAGDKIDGLNQFFLGFEDSSYAHAIDEYRFFKNSPAKVSLDYSGYIVRPLRFRAPPSAHFNDLTQASFGICMLAASGQLSLGKRTDVSFFPVYLDRPRPAGEACSVHGYQQFGTFDCPGNARLKNRMFMIALFYDLEGDSDCDIDDQLTGHSPGLSALANQTARTLADIHTDPFFAAFYDANLNEVDDKCAWTFQVPFVTFDDGSQWKLQSLWSNAAYESGTGFPNADGARGCIVGP